MTTADLPQIDTLAAESASEGFQFLTRWRDALLVSTAGLNESRQCFLGVFDDDALLAVGGVTPDPYDAQIDLGRVRHVYVARAATTNWSGAPPARGTGNTGATAVRGASASH